VRSLLVRLACALVNRVVGDSTSAMTAHQTQEVGFARLHDPYFQAFRNRCMAWVYGDDPRRALEK